MPRAADAIGRSNASVILYTTVCRHLATPMPTPLAGTALWLFEGEKLPDLGDRNRMAIAEGLPLKT